MFRRGIKRELVTRKSTIQKLCNQTQHHLSFKHFRQPSDEIATSLATTGFRASSLKRQQSSGFQSLGLQSSGVPSQVRIQESAGWASDKNPDHYERLNGSMIKGRHRFYDTSQTEKFKFIIFYNTVVILQSYFE